MPSQHFHHWLFLFLAWRSLLAQSDPIANLKPGEWYEAPNSRLRQVAPANPPGDVSCVITCWSGGAYDTKRDRLIVWGGGHGQYAGNEIYVFDVNKLQWERVNDPSADVGGDERTGLYPDGTPRSRHTYNYIQYVPVIDRFCSLGGAVFYPSGQVGTDKTYGFNFDAKKWELFASTPTSGIGSFSAVDFTTGHVWQHGPCCEASVLSRYDPVKNVWAIYGDKQGWLGYYRTAAIGKNKFVAIGDGEVLVWDLKNPGESPVNLQTTGGDSVVKAQSPGFDFDRISNRFVAWHGGQTVYALDLDMRTWKKHDGRGANPGAPAQWGTFGRFRYMPSKNAFIVVNSVDDNVFIYKLAASTTVRDGGSGAVPEASIIRVYPSPAGPAALTQIMIFNFRRNYFTALLRIYNINGQLIKDFGVITASSNQTTIAIAWNGRDDNNRLVPSGLYTVVLRTKETQYTQQFSFTK